MSTSNLVIQMGPQHPSTHGVLRIEIETEGEWIQRATPDIGYLHRCFEKHAETLEYIQVIPYVDRMDYISAMNMEWGFALTVERLANLEIPPRADWLRLLLCEWNRIASHLLAIGTYSMDVGGFTPFLYAFKEREKILQIFEEISGARLLYNFIRPGGLAGDVRVESLTKMKNLAKSFRTQLQDMETLLTENPIFLARTCGVGVVTDEQALAMGWSGPNLRGSGVNWDLRKNSNYGRYSELEFNVCIAKAEHGVLGDCWNRYSVRIQEMKESLKIIEQVFERLEPGEVLLKGARLVKPQGEMFLATECPRGELGFHIVADGTKKPNRVKVKSSAFQSLMAVESLCKGMLVADMVAFLGSLDIMLGEIDR